MPPGEAPADLQAALERAWERGAGAWPGLVVERKPFFQALLDRVEPLGSPVAALERLAVTDLYLCCAVLAGEAKALAALDGLLGVADATLLRIGGHPAFVDDVKQRVRIKLLVPAAAADQDHTGGGRASLASYGARGELLGFLRVLLVREALGQRRSGERQLHYARQSEETAGTSPAVAADDPELVYLRRTYGAACEAAFGEAVAALSPAERTLLRYHYVERLNIDQIGALEGIHRVSAARRLTKVRELLVRETRRLLGTRLQMSTGDVGSVLRLLHSDLDLSVRRLLSSNCLPDRAT